MVTRQREHQVTCSGSDSPSLLALPDPEHESTMTLRNVRKHTNNRIPHDLKHRLNYTFPRTLGSSVSSGFRPNVFIRFISYHACYTPTHITGSSHSKTDRQMEASTECRSAQFPQFSSLSGRLPAGDPHGRLPAGDPHGRSPPAAVTQTR